MEEAFKGIHIAHEVINVSTDLLPNFKLTQTEVYFGQPFFNFTSALTSVLAA
jgi:hemolysin-activating ACP:hemolysin acyltransferase